MAAARSGYALIPLHNAVVAVVALLVGAIAALLLVLTRWQAVHLLPAEWYYRILGVHGMNMLIFFIIFFEMAILYFAGPVMLNCRQPAPKTAWAGFGLMLVGALLVNVVVLAGKADVLFSSYVPLKAHPLYYLGIILFAVGALIASLLFFAALVVAKREKSYSGSVPLVTFGGLTAAIIPVITSAVVPIASIRFVCYQHGPREPTRSLQESDPWQKFSRSAASATTLLTSAISTPS